MAQKWTPLTSFSNSVFSGKPPSTEQPKVKILAVLSKWFINT